MNDITRTTVSVGEGPPQPIGGTLIVLAIDHFARPDGLTDHRISQFIANGMLARDRRSLALVMRAQADLLDPPGPQLAVARELPPNGPLE